MADLESSPEMAHSSPKIEEDQVKSAAIPKLPLLGASLLYMIANYMNTFGNLSMYVGSYMYTVGKNEWLRYRNISAVFGIIVLFQSLSGLFAADFQRYFGTKLAIILSSSVIALSFVLCAFGLYSYSAFVTFYGVIPSIASGLLLPLPLDIMLKRHSKHRGFVCGFIYFVGGIISICLIPVQTYFVNISDEKFGDSLSALETFHKPMGVVDRIPRLFICQGIIYLLSMLLALKFLGIREATQPMEGTNSDLEYETFITKRLVDPKESSDADTVFGSALCYTLWLFLLLCWLSSIYIHTYWKVAALKKLDIPDLTISIIGTIAGFANLFGRCIWGFIFDSFGWKLCWTFLLIGSSAATAGTQFLFEPNVRFYTMWVTLVYFIHSGVLTISPMTAHRLFGPSVCLF
ncbi:conserved hypothetical protein [Theileria equi strain WA]|uniref:Uncharacterized protein n=1 Tax=Theileria equi strain WA TaxID=1537102 RepID=L1LC73_THEEQ|nr:conserved hypothetical protein [Theileria equi strain WA]EKX72879.1 conserved hypothetical protein [Theileria equi strain WA]|eukprot:XP_004832331.1 conserved hypothetical protein [Theileria equi strain WA]